MKKSQNRYFRPTYARIDLSCIRYNLSQIRKKLDKNTKVLVAVKADAYGHGIIEVSNALVKSGLDYLGVATADEALTLRRGGIKVPILIMSCLLPDEVEAIIKNNITQTVADIKLASCINRCAARLKKRARVHIKIDIGMGRIGIWHTEALKLIKQLKNLKNIELEGIFTHLPNADEDEVLTKRQISDFSLLIDELQTSGITIKYRHMANSIALLDYKDSHMNLVRPGLIVYGLYPLKSDFRRKIKLRPALSLKTKIVFIKDVPAGRKISYGGTYTIKYPTRIATIPIGYGDGLNRRISNRGEVLIRGKRAPILGAVCMDQIMVDCGKIADAKVGDEVVLIGRQKKHEIRVEEIAGLCETIPYEVVCWISKRVPRVYK
ncbi:MAG: alanine racemase [Candidatus Omnitrophica bacterium]|nr:alanine racemase [Candidatus Omnitrophota bacterium]